MSHTDPLAPQTAPDDSVLLTARGIRKSFGNNEVLRSIDLEVRRGEVDLSGAAMGAGTDPQIHAAPTPGVRRWRKATRSLRWPAVFVASCHGFARLCPDWLPLGKQIDCLRS